MVKNVGTNEPLMPKEPAKENVPPNKSSKSSEAAQKPLKSIADQSGTSKSLGKSHNPFPSNQNTAVPENGGYALLEDNDHQTSSSQKTSPGPQAKPDFKDTVLDGVKNKIKESEMEEKLLDNEHKS